VDDRDRAGGVMAALPEPWKSLREKIEAITERVKKLENAASNKFSGTGLSVPSDGVTQVDGSLVVQSGDARSGNYVAGSTGWHLPASGAAEFTDIVILGVAVGSDAPVKIQVSRLYAEAFSLTTSYSQKDSTSLTVPTGCTRLLAILSASMYVVNQNTTGGSDTNGGDAIYVRATIQSSNTGGSPIGLTGYNGFTTTTSNDTFQLTGLNPGDTVSFGVEGKSGYQSIPAYVDNWIKATATLVWLR
jgi:hypothetical protein